jgi:hypothetical protein
MVAAALVSMLIRPSTTHAQYIEREEEMPGIQARFLSAGVVRREFSAMPSNTAPDDVRIGFGRILPSLLYHQAGFEIMGGYGTYRPGGVSAPIVFLTSTYTSEFPSAGLRGRAIALSLALGADYAKSGSKGTARDDFNLASVGIGAGVASSADLGGVRMSLSAHALIHLSYEAYSTRSASSPAVIAGATFMISGGPIGDGVAVGYRFRWQQWSTGGYFDYRTLNHGLFVGVLF